MASPPYFGPGLMFRRLIRLYSLILSPLLSQNCRHLPTCSAYADEALRRHGAWAGLWLTLSRFLRCGPFGTSGHDPVPEALNKKACWYLPWRYGRWSGRHIDPDTRLE